VRELNQVAVPWVPGAINFVCHGEERSDVAIHLGFQPDCRARRAELAMTIRGKQAADVSRSHRTVNYPGERFL
jgi:hypothetical protein